MERKVFAGGKLRRIRNELGLTQTSMAAELEISPSYLNLIERNQRPLTVQLLMKLGAVYKIDMSELRSEATASLSQLKEVFSDPLLARELPGEHELLDMLDAAPNVAAGILKLFRAYQEQGQRLTDITGSMPAASGPRLPLDEVRDVLEGRSSFFAKLEDAAEALVMSLPVEPDVEHSLKAWLKTERGISVRILPVHVMPDVRRRFDRHSGRLFVSERLSREEMTEELAMEVALLALSSAIRSEVEALRLSTPEAERIARFSLGRLAALAILMPYGRFHQSVVAARYDVDVLRSRFRTSFAQVATRLTMLQRPEASGIPFFLMELDSSNHRLRLIGANGFPHSRFGGQCPKLNIYNAFLQPGQVLSELVKLPDGASYLTVARSIESPAGAYGERQRRTALLLGCEAIHRAGLVYSDGLAEERSNPIGPACRLCERRGCLARAEPPITKPLGLDEMVTGNSAFDFL